MDWPTLPLMGYRVEATTVEGFVQQLAVAYVQRGYVFYVTGDRPGRKDPAAVDAKLLAKYGVARLPVGPRRPETGGPGQPPLHPVRAVLRPARHPRGEPVLRRGGRGHPGRPPGAD